jgi:hypothetical protein
MKYLTNLYSPEEEATMYALRKWAHRFYPGDAAQD